MALIRIKNGYAIINTEDLYDGDGTVTRWHREQSLLLKSSLRFWAPVRTGRLQRSINVTERREAARRRTINVRFGARYARYTDKGTYGPITSRSGKKMPVGKSQGASGKSIYRGSSSRRKADYTYKAVVRGQEGTNWVSNAIRNVPAFSGYRD